MKEDINTIGIKAYSLKLLKARGLFTQNLYITSFLPEKEEFVKNLKNEGFRENDEFMCRFSHPLKSVNLPRTICNTFEESYNFYKKHFKSGFTIVIQRLMHAKYEGTLSKIDNELVMEFIEGDWSGDYSLNIDTVIFSHDLATWYLYKGFRKVPYVAGREIKYKVIDPLSDETARKIFKNIIPKLPQLNDLLSGDFNSLELLIDDDAKIQPLKLLNILSSPQIKLKPIEDGVFELKTPYDLKRWDKKSKLLISIPANIDRADALMGIIHEIKKYTTSVFIGYGELSHPAILLREAGIHVERRISNYKILKMSI